MYTVTIFSNRMYENEFDYSNTVDETIETFNKILYSVYNLTILSFTDKEKYNKKPDGKSLHLYVKNKYHLDDYYANSIIRLAKGKVDSQIKLNKEYKKQKEFSLKELNSKLKDAESKLDNYINLRTDYIEYRNNDFKGKIKIKGIKNISIKDNFVEVRYMKNGKIVTKLYGAYKFEYEYLNKKIHHLRNLIGKYKYRIYILENRIKNLGSIKHSIFGSRKLMKEYNKCDNHKDKENLRRMILFKKYKNFSILGRKDAKTGNFIFKPIYDKESDTFTITVRMIDKTEITFHNISFKYRGDDLRKALNSAMPICFGITKKQKDSKVYYLISASFDLECVRNINSDVSVGIVGIDFNYNHIDVSDVDEKGNMVNSFTIYYKTDGDALQNELSLRKALTEVAKYISDKHKTLVIESLDLKTAKFKANRDKPKNKSLNKVLHTYPYQKYLEIVKQLGMKYQFLVTEVNPAFTSVIGKNKYSGKMKLSTHIAASYVIARRGMCFNERLLKNDRNVVSDSNLNHKSEWAKWNFINKALEKTA